MKVIDTYGRVGGDDGSWMEKADETVWVIGGKRRSIGWSSGEDRAGAKGMVTDLKQG